MTLNSSALSAPWPFTRYFDDPIKDDGKVPIFTRDDFRRNVKARRREFVHSLFGEELKQLFTELQTASVKEETCHKEVTFAIPQHYDHPFVEKLLCTYFEDLGYGVMTEPSKILTNKITLTLT